MSGWQARRWPEAPSFLDRAETWLMRAEAEYNLILSIAYSLQRSGRADPSAYLATIEQGDTIGGCAFRTPPFKLGLTQIPVDAVPVLVDDVAAVYDALPAVLGPEPGAGAFARAWSEARRVSVGEPRLERIYRLDRVIPVPARTPGALRQAGPADQQLISEWIDAFTRETAVTPHDPEAAAKRLIDIGAAFVWEDRGPVSLASATGATPNGMRIGYVYTPPSQRGRGYASAAVAALSQRVLDSGRRFCVLYTDLANPTSNRIYHRIGYEPVADVADYAFAA